MLVDSLKTALSDSFVFRVKAQYYHWNVEGEDFAQYHEFLGELYAEVDAAVDGIAELIRTLDSYSPGTLERFKQLTTIEESEVVPSARTMIANLYSDNLTLLSTLRQAYEEAESEKQFGISNYLQDRITAHEKHGWMLKALTK